MILLATANRISITTARLFVTIATSLKMELTVVQTEPPLLDVCSPIKKVYGKRQLSFVENYLLVHYPKDDTVSVVHRNNKQVVQICDSTIRVKWPQGVFNGKILERSGKFK